MPVRVNGLVSSGVRRPQKRDGRGMTSSAGSRTYRGQTRNRESSDPFSPQKAADANLVANVILDQQSEAARGNDEFTIVTGPSRSIRVPVVDVADLTFCVAVGNVPIACFPIRFILRSDVCPVSTDNFQALGGGAGRCTSAGFEHRH